MWIRFYDVDSIARRSGIVIALNRCGAEIACSDTVGGGREVRSRAVVHSASRIDTPGVIPDVTSCTVVRSAAGVDVVGSCAVARSAFDLADGGGGDSSSCGVFFFLVVRVAVIAAVESRRYIGEFV